MLVTLPFLASQTCQQHQAWFSHRLQLYICHSPKFENSNVNTSPLPPVTTPNHSLLRLSHHLTPRQPAVRFIYSEDLVMVFSFSHNSPEYPPKLLSGVWNACYTPGRHGATVTKLQKSTPSGNLVLAGILAFYAVKTASLSPSLGTRLFAHGGIVWKTAHTRVVLTPRICKPQRFHKRHVNSKALSKLHASSILNTLESTCRIWSRCGSYLLIMHPFWGAHRTTLVWAVFQTIPPCANSLVPRLPIPLPPPPPPPPFPLATSISALRMGAAPGILLVDVGARSPLDACTFK